MRLRACWALAFLWSGCTIWASIAPQSPAGMIAAGVQFLALLIIVLLHASLSAGWRGAFCFFAILCLTSFILEAISVRTGVPFGFFEHHTPGPRPLDIPLLIPLGYAIYGWLAWSQTRTLLDSLAGVTRRFFLLAAPLIGAFVLAGYDYPWDAIGATILHIHSYRDPSGLFGVPLLNFIGWLVTGWAAFMLFALVEHRFARVEASKMRAHDLLPPLIWIAIAGSYFFRFSTAPSGTTSVAGRHFVIADVLEASAAISLPAMIMPALIVIVAAMARPGENPAER